MPTSSTRVVVVDVQVARRSATVRSNSAWRAKQLQHVVEEADAGRDVGLARPVEVEADGDRRSPLVLRVTLAARIVSTPAARPVEGPPAAF